MLPKKVRQWLAASALLLPFISAAQGQAQLQIHFLDVGQGDTTLLHQPGACTALIDAGRLLHGHRITAQLEELGIDSLDMVIITHPHLDHFGGLFDLAPRLPIKQFYDNGTDNPAVEYFDDYRKLRQAQPYEVLTQGDRLSCGDIEIAVLYPGTGAASGNLNEASLALMISHGTFKLLHMGDLSGEAEQIFLEQNQDIKANGIKIAHHGAADATSEKLLVASKPEFAIISSGSDSGTPAGSVLKRLASKGISLYRTDQHGSIRLLVSSGSYQVQAP